MVPRSVLRLLLSAVAALILPTAFLAPAAHAAGVSATATITASTPQELTIDVEGTGYSGESPGIYVGVSEPGGASPTDASVYRGTKFLTPDKIVDGAFSTTLTLDAAEIATLDSTKTYSVYTLKAHGQAATDPSQTTEVPLNIDFSTLSEPDEPDDGEGQPGDGDPEEPGEGSDDDHETTTPTVRLSQTEFSSDGTTTATVTGTGFDPALQANGTRPPLAGQPSGFYVVFGKFADEWRPSQGAASSTRVIGDQKWAVPAAQIEYAQTGPFWTDASRAQLVELKPDGSFVAEVKVDKSAISDDVAGRFGVYTFAGSGAVAADLETYTPITFADPGPSLDVDVTEQASGVLKIAAVGSGYAPVFPGVYVTLAPSGGPDTQDAGASVAAAWIPNTAMDATGGFATELDLSAEEIAKLDPGTDYSVYTFKAHGMPDPGGTQTVEVPVELDVDLIQGKPVPSGPSLGVEVTEQAAGVLKISAVGAGYATVFPGVYVTLAPSGGPDTQNSDASVAAAYISNSAMDATGGFTTELDLSAEEIAKLDPGIDYSVYTFKAHGMPDPGGTQTVEQPIDIDVNLVQGNGPTDPGDGGDGDSGSETVPKTKGSLRWGVKAAFRSYVTGSIAKGSISVSGGASASGGTYRFYQKFTSAKADGTGTTRYGGTVTFTGHSGALSLRVSDPTITVSSASRGTLSAVAGGSRITLATLDLSRATKRTASGAVTFSGAPATLTSAGAGAFQGYYSAGESLDPVTFTIGANGGAAGGSSTVATAAVQPTFVPPSIPPSTSGLTLDGVQDGDELKAGDVVTATASGFEPNESGIAVVVYSTPVVLSQAVTADAQGNATWTGPLPGSLEPGEHTLTFQGSVDRGVTFTVAEDDQEIGACSVEDASLTWGVKESWRAYVSGSIANGDWTTSGNASYETPEFTFSDGTGDFDGQAATGDVVFDGAIEFTGHSGALKVVLADPVVRLVDADSAVLMLDVTAGDREAAESSGDASTTTTEGVPFAELDLSKATVERSDDGTSITVTDAPATLTEQGHQVFSTYETGSELDPVDIAVTTSADCAQTPEVAAESSAASVAPTGGDDNSTIWWIAGAAALAAVLGGGVWLVRRPGSE